MKTKRYHFTAPLWRYSSDAASWFFVYVDEGVSEEIRELVKQKKIRTKGFSFVPVEVTVGKSTWETTLFPAKEAPYLLSINKRVRQQEGIFEGDVVEVIFRLV